MEKGFISAILTQAVVVVVEKVLLFSIKIKVEIKKTGIMPVFSFSKVATLFK
jgi:hypothetical protein